MRKTVKVALGARSYDIVIGPGALDEAGALIHPLLVRPFVVVVTDKNVAAAQGARIEAALARAGIAVRMAVIAAGEQSKSFGGLEALCETLLGHGVERRDLIVAFGGGVVGDLTGFAAAILRRGCRFVQVPTTLLAQVDSSVGGKTAINARVGKNLIGAFHQPELVICDPTALTTLPLRERRAGYAEIVKYAAIGDRGFFAQLESEADGVLAAEPDACVRAVERSCAMKAAIVAADERESGERALLNFGHTFGHALEAASGYSDRLLHGEAVSAGMALAFDYSAARGLCAAEDAVRFKHHLRAAGLPASLADIGGGFRADDLIDLMMQDKKTESGRLTLILVRGIGAAFIEKAADTASVRDFLTSAGAT